MEIKVILFDMDGVLINAKDWHYDALNKALSIFGIAISRYDHLLTYDGLPTRKKLEMLSVEKKLPRGLHSFLNRLKQQYTTEEVFLKCRPNFHHEYALSTLKKDGYKMAVCSNSVRSTIELMMEKSSLKNYFEFMLSNEDVSKAKPDPEMYNLGIQKMNVHPREVLIIEDNQNGLKAAHASGAHVLEVSDIHDVTYKNITSFISKIKKESNT